MTIEEMIKKLESIKRGYPDIEIFFDCPKCKESFTPSIVIILAAHIAGKK